VILFVLLAGYLPFHDSNLMELYRKIGKAEFRFPSWFPRDARRLISRILDPNPNTRISMSKIRESSWFRRGLNSGLKKTDTDAASSSGSGSGENPTSSDEKPELTRLSNLNAFDIISLSDGFDLSSLFEEPCLKKETRFTSLQPAPVIISKIEEVGKHLRLKVSKRDGGLMKLEGVKEGRKGILSIDAEIFEVTPSFHMVEMKKTGGDTLEYQKVLKEGLRPALQDIVWAWQGEEQKHEQQPQQQGQIT